MQPPSMDRDCLHISASEHTYGTHEIITVYIVGPAVHDYQFDGKVMAGGDHDTD